MKIKQRMVSFFVISLLALSVVSIAPIRLNSVKAQLPSASLLGVISNKGVNPNPDGLYRHLNVTVGINVAEPGNFVVESDLINKALNATSPNAQASGYLNAGPEQLTLSFYGPTINHARLDPYSLGDLFLFTENNTFVPISYLHATNATNAPLLRLSPAYNYSEFDPIAVLTGKIYDKGVDTNGDGLFDYLQIGVEVNITDAEAYTVDVQLLYSPNLGELYNSSTVNLSPDLQIVNVTLNGAMIRLSKMNFSTVDSIFLQEANNEINGIYASQSLGSFFNVQLSTTYLYTKFQSLAFFTGKIIDKGVSNSGDSKFDYLEIDVQINITEAGNYQISIYGLYGSTFNSSWVNYTDYKIGYFSVGLHFVNFTCPSQMIYASKANVTSIGSIQLFASIGERWWSADQLSNVPLSKTYNYTGFNPHAYFTGRVYDIGVDTDRDGLFDYLQTNIEVNVTEAGTYQVWVTGLAENASNWFYDYQVSNPLNLNKGIHLFNFTFYGPQIAIYGINPRNVTGISLYELSNSSAFSGQVDYMQSAPLSKQYNCSEFDHPLNAMQLTFTVYPDGQVGIGMMENSTHMYPGNTYGSVINATARFSKTNNLILGSINGTVGLPSQVTVPWPSPYPYGYNQAQFPTNQTTADYVSQYNNGILTEKLNATSLFPPIVKTQYPYNTTDFTLSGTYSNGMMHAQLRGNSTIPQEFASEFPFNATDVTVEANLGNNNEFKGNITLHLVSGLPIGDLKVNFEGNRSDMQFTGYVNAIYGTYNGVEVNATTVSQFISKINSTIPGIGSNSLYNMTNGTLECTNIEITNTTITGGVRIDYNASIRGDFAALLAMYINKIYFPYSADQYYPTIYAALNATLSSVDNVSVVLAYIHAQNLALMDISFDSNAKTLWSNALKLIPPTVPLNKTSELNAWLELGNATAYAVQNAWLNITYSGTEPQPSLALSVGLVENAAQLNNDTVKLIPVLYSLYSDLYHLQTQNITQLQNIIKSYLNETYATLHSYNTTIHLKNGIAAFRTDFSFEGDLDKQFNAAKSYYLNLLNYEYSLTKATLPTQMRLLNQTNIDINGLGVDFRYGRDNAFLNVTGLVVSPPIQTIDSFRFKLSNFLNVTSENNEPPTRYQKLKIIIQGGSNSTYTIIPTRPATVLAPDKISLDRKTFIWENTTVSSLKDMILNIAYQGSYQNGGTTYYVPILSNSTASNFNFDLNKKTISFNVTGPLGTTGFCNITIPRSLLDISAPNPWIIEQDGNRVTATQYNVTQNAEYTFIYLVYTHSSHTISIVGNTSSVPEMQPNTIPFIILLISLIALFLIATQKRKIRSLKTKSVNIAYRMANSFSRLLKK